MARSPDTFPSAAGLHTSDDSGLYFLPTRDAGALVDPATEEVTAELMHERHRERVLKLLARAVRSAALPHEERSKACVSLQCQYTLDTWGKFPGTVQSMWVMNFLQAQHIDLDFYDHHFRAGAYLDTHRRHMTLGMGWTAGVHAPPPRPAEARDGRGAHARPGTPITPCRGPG
jgi:hypothetical protein